jgi:hypothetical protein
MENKAKNEMKGSFMKTRPILVPYFLTVCLALSIVRLTAQTYPYWDASPDQIVGISSLECGVGNGQYVYFADGLGPYSHSIQRWSKSGGWECIGTFDQHSDLNALTIGGNYLYVAGSFGGVSDGNFNNYTSAQNIARCDLNTGQWSALGTNILDREVYSIAADSFGNVYVGTWTVDATNLIYTSDGILDPGAIMKWNGTNWTNVGGGLLCITNACPSGVDWDTYIQGLATDGTNIFATGGFRGFYDGTNFVPSHCVIKWNGNNWVQMGGVSGVYDSCDGCDCDPVDFTMWRMSIVVSGTNVFVTGRFNSPSAGLARFSATTGEILPCNGLYRDPDGNTNGWGKSLAVQNGMVYVTGGFSYVGNVSANGVARWNSTNGTWSALSSGLTSGSDSGSGNYVAVNGNAAFVTGGFDQAGGVAIPNNPRIARWVTGPEPCNCPSQPFINDIVRNTNNTVTIFCSGTAGCNYLMQAATNLVPPVVWQNVSTNVADTNGTWQFTDSLTNGGVFAFCQTNLVYASTNGSPFPGPGQTSPTNVIGTNVTCDCHLLRFYRAATQ